MKKCLPYLVIAAILFPVFYWIYFIGFGLVYYGVFDLHLVSLPTVFLSVGSTMGVVEYTVGVAALWFVQRKSRISAASFIAVGALVGAVTLLTYAVLQSPKISYVFCLVAGAICGLPAHGVTWLVVKREQRDLTRESS